tara:strand:+ start:632 stop:1510 length:879 start_codon:yes stop_codon:yes gene_type:complete
MKNRIKKLLISNYTLSNFYGGFGNNLQQIALGIMHSNLNGYNFYSKEHELLDNISQINNKLSNFFNKYRFDSRFFYFDNTSKNLPTPDITDFPLDIKDRDYYLDNFYYIFQHKIFPKLNFLKNIDIDDKTIVIHIRSGDIFAKKDGEIISNVVYIQNPLNYYLNLIERYEKTIIVSSQPFNNPVISLLMDHPKVEIQSNSIEEDFNILLNAKNLATSGVGTFAIAAALSSKKLINLHYSNLFFDHHLNPTMVKNVNHHMYRFKEYFNIGDIWDGDVNQVEKMLSPKIEVIDI